jgi:uncharacterized membrane protein
MRQGGRLKGWTGRRLLSAVAGGGMMAAAAASMQVYYATTYAAAGTAGSVWCAGGGLFDCDAAVLSSAGTVAGIPIGWAGFVLGAAVLLGALLPSRKLEQTNRALLAINAVLVTALFFYATLALQTLCLVCTGYGIFSILAVAVHLHRQFDDGGITFAPAPMHVLVLALTALAGGQALTRYDDAVRTTHDTLAGMRSVGHFYSLPLVPWPSEISPFRTLSATPEFEDAAIRIVQFADPLCIDCRVLHEQLRQLAQEFAGMINVAYQFFPLEAACNDVVDKDKHPGSCDLSYMAAHDPSKFGAIHDEIYDNMAAAKERSWQLDLARRHDVEAALTDTVAQAAVRRLIRTGTEFERTSDRYAHGIRSTPTMIINNRMIIGTLPTDQLRAIFRALVDEHANGGSGFMENWLTPGCVIDGLQPCGSQS